MRSSHPSRMLAGLALACGALCAAGCRSAARRNLTEALLVTATPTLAEADVKLILELRDRRAEFRLPEADAFLASDGAAGLSRRLRSELADARRKLHKTIAAARRQIPGGFALLRPEPDRPWASDNIVLYLAGRDAVDVFFSYDQIGRLLSYPQVADDLTTVRYLHPGFTGQRLGLLRDRLAELGLPVRNVSISGRRREQLKTAAAARVLERYLRRSGASLPPGLPLLASGPVAPPRSEKLSRALADRDTVERIVRSGNPDVIRALVHLVRRGVVRLAYP